LKAINVCKVTITNGEVGGIRGTEKDKL